jgi:hypothetical protein
MLGAASAALFLTRTDLLWFPVVITAVMVMRGRWADVAVFCSCIGFLVLPYLAYNYVSQGSLMPISGRVKLFYLATYFPTLESYIFSDEWSGIFAAVAKVIGLEHLTKTLGISPKFAVLAAVPIVTIIIGRGMLTAYREYQRKGVTSFMVFSVAIISHVIYMQFIYRELRIYTAYYFVPDLIWMATVIGKSWAASLDRAAPPDDTSLSGVQWRIPTQMVLSCMMAVIALASIHIRTSAPSPFWTSRLAVAKAITKTPEIGQHIGAFWPGALAYFSKAPIAPLDGIISSQEYFEGYIKTGKQLEYMQKHGIDNLLVVLTPAEVESIRSEHVPARLVWPKDYIRLLAQNRVNVEVAGVWPTATEEAQSAFWYWLKLNPRDQSISTLH